MTWPVVIILILEIGFAVFFLAAIIIKLAERIREYKKDRYKNIKY